MRPWLFNPSVYSGQSQKLAQGLCSGRMIAGTSALPFALERVNRKGADFHVAGALAPAAHVDVLDHLRYVATRARVRVSACARVPTSMACTRYTRMMARLQSMR